ncbi:MAG: hypothetical protein C4306_10655 [Thermoleophilia bacterium]
MEQERTTAPSLLPGASCPGWHAPAWSTLDGEIVLEREGRPEFDLLQLRLHPAESRIRKLSSEMPARYVVFDLLLWGGEPVWQLSLEERRKRLEKLPFDVAPASCDPAQGQSWLERLETLGLDGVVCKRLSRPYLPGSREGAVKVKRHRTADCVVVGVRWRRKPHRLATLLLGLYDRDDLVYVGSCAVAPARQGETLSRIAPLLEGAPRRPLSQPSRWGTSELEESALRPELVVEVRYDKLEARRFRRGTRFLRFRTDKDPRRCTLRPSATAVLPRRPDPGRPASGRESEEPDGVAVLVALRARRAPSLAHDATAIDAGLPQPLDRGVDVVEPEVEPHRAGELRVDARIREVACRTGRRPASSPPDLVALVLSSGCRAGGWKASERSMSLA